MIVRFLQTVDVSGKPRFHKNEIIHLDDSLAEELLARGVVELAPEAVQEPPKKPRTARKS